MHRTEALYNEGNLFVNGPPGTFLGAEWFNAVQEELANVIEESGLTLNTQATETYEQLKAALDLLYSKNFHYYNVDSSQLDQGAVSADSTTYTIYDVAQLVGVAKSAVIHLKHNPANGNTTTYVFDTNLDLTLYPNLFFKIDPGARITRTTGDEILTLYSLTNIIADNDQQIANSDMLLFATGNMPYKWAGFSSFDYYVNTTTGSDTYNGLSASRPFATIQKAIDVVCKVSITNETVVIHVADGTYDESLILKQNFSSAVAGTNTPIIQGNSGDNTAVSISPAAGNCVTAVGVSSPWHFKDLEFTSTSNGVVADFGSVIYLENVNFDTCTLQHILAQWNSKVEFINDDYTISGGATTHAYAVRNSMILMQGGNTVTLTGSPAFTYFAYAGRNCVVDYTGVTFSGAATGIQGNQIYGGQVVDAHNLPGDAIPTNNDYNESSVVAGSAISLTTGTPANITSLTLPAGEYDFWGFAVFQGAAGTTINYITSSIGSVSATLDNTPDKIDWRFLNGGTPFGVTNDISAICGPVRVLLNTSTTIYLVAQAGFGVSTCAVYGKLRARRITEY